MYRLPSADGKPVERFLGFIPIQSHTGEDLAAAVLQFICTKCNIDFVNCRGQLYDNAANMSGRYNGMQQKILERNPLAVYIPCAGHSLNLVRRAAVDCCLAAVSFFLLHNNFIASSQHPRIVGQYWINFFSKLKYQSGCRTRDGKPTQIPLKLCRKVTRQS